MTHVYAEDFEGLNSSILSDGKQLREEGKKKAAENTQPSEVLSTIIRAFSSVAELNSSQDAQTGSSPVSEQDPTEAAPVSSPTVTSAKEPSSPIEAPKEAPVIVSKEERNNDIKDIPLPYHVLDRSERISVSNELEEGLYHKVTATPGQRKYILNMKKKLNRLFDYYSFLKFCIDFRDSYPFEEEEFLFAHIVYTMPHPELYIDLLSFEPFMEDISFGGHFYSIDQFRRAVDDEYAKVFSE